MPATRSAHVSLIDPVQKKELMADPFIPAGLADGKAGGAYLGQQESALLFQQHGYEVLPSSLAARSTWRTLASAGSSTAGSRTQRHRLAIDNILRALFLLLAFAISASLLSALFLGLAFAISGNLSSDQTAPEPKKFKKETCLACHGPFDKLITSTADYVWPNGQEANPHRYEPHSSRNAKDIPECTLCHKQHAMPPSAATTAAMDKANPEWCYSCHHEKDLTCGTCHP